MRHSWDLLGQQCEGIHVARAEQSKVATVQRRQLRLVQALDDGEDGRVDKANIGVGIAVTELADAAVILR